MLLLIWLLPIQVFRTTAVLVVASAIGFVVFLRQLKAESPAPAPAPPRTTRSATGGRAEPSGSAQAAGRQSSHRPWSTTSWARIP